MADLLEALAKLKLDTSEYRKGLSEAQSESQSTTNAIGQAFSTLGQKIGTIDDFVKEMKAGFVEGMKESEEATKSATRPLDTLKTKIKVAESAVRGSQTEVNRLSDALNKSAKEAGEDAEETHELAEQLKKAEAEMKENEDELKKLQDELKGYGKEAEEASEKSEKSGNSIKDAFGTVAKAGVTALKVAVEATAAAIGAVATGVGFLVKSSVDAFGEYQQLAGGAQKIFDEMDFSVIQNDAKNAYKELNMSINDYIESINLAGATFSATMGDEAAYNTARKGMLAISDFATGTGKDINELTQKYQMITRAASSYQSIADQFAGILPQTSADFLEQAQAAGLLSEKYEKLTEVPVAEYQQAVTDMLALGVENLGLANNAMNESMDTLTGSMAMTKAAWENLVMALGDGESDLTEYIDKFVESASASFTNILPIVEQALNGVGQLIEEIVPKIMNELSGMMEEGGLFENLLNAGKNVIESIARGIEENIDTVTNFAESIIEMLGSTLETVLPTLVRVGISILSTIGGSIIENLDSILETGGVILEEIIMGLTQNIDSITSAAITIVKSLGQFVIDNADLLLSAATEIALALIRGVTENIGDIVVLALQILNVLASSILENIDVILLAVPPLIEGFVSGLVENLPLITDTWVKLMGSLEEALPQIVDAILIVLPQLMDILVNYWLGDGAKQTFQAFLVMFGQMNLALMRIGAEVIAKLGMFLRETGSTIAGGASELLTAAKTFFSAIGTAIAEKAVEIKGKVSTLVTNIKTTITDGIKNIVDKAKTWGKDLISNFIGGIKEKFGAFKDTVGSITGFITNNLGHSHPSEGPMADDYTWMPDMMDLFISGIKANEKKLQDTVTSAFDFKDDITAPSMATGASAQTAQVESSIDKLLSNLSINLYNTTEIDGKEIKKDSYKYTVQRLGDETRAVRIAMGGY